MDWPACSLDMNPIEHAWDVLGRYLASQHSPPWNVQQMETALIVKRHRTHQSPYCIYATVLVVRGDHTPY